MPVEVKAPYNFVPLNDRVFIPDWGKYVSHDIPFKNQKSGKIELTITAESPIFIRGKEEDYPNTREDKIWKKYGFPQFGNRYYIPGSSVRGMIRSILEIMSFSKMGEANDFYNDHRFGVRDFQNRHIYGLLDDAGKIRTGWLVKEDDQFVIYDCDKMATDCKVKHEHIRVPSNSSRFANKSFGTIFSKNGSDAKAKTAKAKYALYFGNEAKVNFNSGLVFSGQMTPNDNNQFSKKNEFQFPTLDRNGQKRLMISTKLWKEFTFIYRDYENSNSISEDWKFWKNGRLKNGLEVPIFFRLDKEGNVRDMGLSMLYKVPFDNSIGSLIRAQQADSDSSEKMDLAECLFGKISDNRQLKSRVDVAHAFQQGEITELESQTLILGEPKASFYPYYITQDVNANEEINGDYKTYMDNDAKISGRKRYPVKAFRKPNSEQNTKVTTTFKPLERGATFKTSLYYHNLLPEELGAIISAITFHNNSNCLHKMGSAKSFGYGNVRLKIENMTTPEQLQYMKCFETTMLNFDRNWNQSDQLKELVAMAIPVGEPWQLNKLKYHDNVSHFATIKSEKKALPRHSDFMNLSNVNFEGVSQYAFNECSLWKSGNGVSADDIRQRLNSKLTEINQQLSKIAEQKKQEEIKQEALQEQQRRNDEERKRQEEIKKENQEFEVKAREKSLESVISDLPNKLNPLKIAIDNLLIARNEQELPEQEHAVLIQKLDLIYKEAPNKSRWENPYNNNTEKKSIANWVGKEKAEKIVDDIVQQNKST